MPEESNRPYPIVVIDPAWVADDEAMGTKDKTWIRRGDTNDLWLFKFSRVNRGIAVGEHWAEKIAAELALLIDLAHAEVELASLNGRIGCISRRFSELDVPGTELVHGNDLLQGFVTGYEREKRFRQSEHSLPNVIAAITAAVPQSDERERIFDSLVGYLLFDAYILNSDRHHENWALIRGEGPSYLAAPTFDHASALGRELTDEKLDSWRREGLVDGSSRVEWYAKRARTALYASDDAPKPSSQFEVTALVQKLWPDMARAWKQKLAAIHRADVSGILGRIPAEVMSSSSKGFANELLTVTQSEICGEK